ncbi:hypothetical protein [Nocardioides sp.]|uniref:hypothetical protein n=1 Tax=Nocardioides sp. TaxID=35761 RepID=UPI00260FBD20|nr:hypothetical protein [Nocardioides sp.]
MPLPHRSAATGATGVVMALGLLVLTGCTGSPAPAPVGPSPDAASATAPVTLADLPVRRMAVARAPFCPVVPGSVVAAALDVAEAPPAREDSDGDRIRLDGRGRSQGAARDVAHEHGCTWRAGGAEARAWVAVPPAGRALATELAGSLRDAPGCTELADAPSYGARSVGVTCEVGRGTRVVRAGVLGDAWLGCSLDGGRGVAAAEVERRSDLWCAGLLQALDGTSVPTG